jgi:flagellar biosynthesis protein FlhG
MDAYALVKIIGQRNMQPNIQLVINKAESEREANAALSGFIRIAEKYVSVPVKPLGYILNDEHMTRAVKLQVPVLVSFPGSRAAFQFERIANEYLQLPASGEIGISGFLKRLWGGA